MSSALLTSLFAIMTVSVVGLTTALAVLWRRINRLIGPKPVATDHPTVRLPMAPARSGSEVIHRLDDLAGRHRAIESRLARIEASATDSSMMNGTHRVDRGMSSSVVGPTLIAVPNLAAPRAASTEASAELDRRHGWVWAMADEGMPLEAIARQTAQPIGQVELILGLRRGRIASEVGHDA